MRVASRGRVVALVVGALALTTALLVWPRRAPLGPSARPSPPAVQDGAGSCLRVERRASDEAWRWEAVDVAVDLERCTLDVARAPDGDRLEHLLPAGALVAVNGGYFESDYRPTAWVRARSVDLAPVHRTRAGGVLALQASTAYLGPLPGLPFDPELAVQNAPLLVEADGSVGIRGDDGKRAARTVACTGPGGLRFLVVPAPAGDGPTLLELARWLTGVGCDVALNLDGGPSTGVVFAPELGQPATLPRALIAYAIVARPREL